jgi:hypothetical protein
MQLERLSDVVSAESGVSVVFLDLVETPVEAGAPRLYAWRVSFLGAVFIPR